MVILISYHEIVNLHIELSSFCNSSCPTCPRNVDGGLIAPFLRPNSLTEKEFKQIFDSNFLLQIKGINFCGNYGDPIMCKDLIDILEYIAETNPYIDIIMHTNGGIRDKEFWMKLGNLSADKFKNFRIMFSIDGLEDTNHLYRIGVKWDKLMTNVKSFISAGGKAEWDMLIFKHNQHQISEVKKLAKKLGFRRFVEGKPHGFKYNNTIRVIDREGKFERHILKADKFNKMEEVHENHFDKIDFDSDIQKITGDFFARRSGILNHNDKLYNVYFEKIKKYNQIEIKNCMAKDNKEIYVDSNGGVHPCCFLGHINQEFLSLPELILHKQWVEDTIGLENINALRNPLRNIIDSNYFQMIEYSWSKTVEEGKNPMCALKCGIQRPNNFIRIS